MKHKTMLPHSLEAERAVLGAMMLDNACILEVSMILSQDCFYWKKHGKIYTAMLDLFHQDSPVDVITLSEHLKHQGELENLGGSVYLTEIGESAFTSANVLHHAAIVREKHLSRKAILEFRAAEHKLFSGEKLSEILDRIGRLTVSSLPAQNDHSFSEILHRMNDEIDERCHGTVTGIHCGIKKIDEITGGFQNADLIVVAGRTSQGKTAFMIQTLRQAAVKKRLPAGVFELEMPSTQIASRIVAQEAGMSLFGLRRGNLDKEDASRIHAAMNTLSRMPIFIDDTPAVSLEYIRTKARRWKQKHGLGLLCIDYLQLMHMPRAERRDLQIGEVTMGLKSLAKELNIPVILLSQLNREGAKEKRAPKLEDLRDSGAIEQDADLVLFTFRPEPENNPDKARLIVAKHRNGPIGSIDATFNRVWVGFTD